MLDNADDNTGQLERKDGGMYKGDWNLGKRDGKGTPSYF